MPTCSQPVQQTKVKLVEKAQYLTFKQLSPHHFWSHPNLKHKMMGELEHSAQLNHRCKQGLLLGT